LIVRLRVRAHQDIEAILDYSAAEHGHAAAEAYFALLEGALAQLAEHPHIGFARPDLNPAMRSYPFGEHRIFYLLLSDRLSIVRILHKTMDDVRHI
jgi:toxin ParE1/3/4